MSTERRRVIMISRCACAALVFTLGCNHTTSYLDATGRSGHEEATLGWWLLGVACAVVVVVCALVIAGIVRHREEQTPTGDSAAREDNGDGNGHTPQRRQIRSGVAWITVGVAITVVILLITFTGTMMTLNAASHTPSSTGLVMDVTAHQWWWEIRYSDASRPFLSFVTANEVHLPVGEPVRVRLQSADVIHSFWLPQIAGKTDVIPGQTNELWVEARQPGASHGMCGEYCGLQHAMMALDVVAEPKAAFDRWADARRADAASPASGDARTGEIVFERSCGACHAISGTNALGRMGPDLTHVASRASIGAGALANTPANLQRWILHAPDIKQGARMPEIPLDSAELRAVVTYLRTLR